MWSCHEMNARRTHCFFNVALHSLEQRTSTQHFRHLSVTGWMVVRQVVHLL